MSTITVFISFGILILQICFTAYCIPLDKHNVSTKSDRLSDQPSASTRTVSSDFGGRAVDGESETTDEENSREVRETHHTTCQVTTEELAATAQATVTRVLKGICNSREMEERFFHLESQISDQLNIIKSMLLEMKDKASEHDGTMTKGQRKILSTLLRNCNSNERPDDNDASTRKSVISTNDTNASLVDASNEYDTTTLSDATRSPRDAEIHFYNSTVHMEASPLAPNHRRPVFTYYWRITHVNYKLHGWSQRRSLRSPSFYISQQGYRMYIRIYPRQSGENVYVHVGLTKGEHDNSLVWPFTLKHRIVVLDQSNDGNTEDIMSRIWDPVALCSGFNWQQPTTGDNYECVGLGFPHDVAQSRNYICGDSLIIKLIVYMD